MQYMCKQCLNVAELPPDVDPHSVTWCNCCDQDHHHAETARTCSEANHPGTPCWNPPSQPIRDDRCGVCRPIIHFGVAGARLVAGIAGQVPGVN